MAEAPQPLTSPPLRQIVVGVIGYGHLGEFLVNRIANDPKLATCYRLAWVWNRTESKVPQALRCPSLTGNSLEELLGRCEQKDPSAVVDLFVEVCHPTVIEEFGVRLLALGALFVGSTTAFAKEAVSVGLRSSAERHRRSIIIPCGAMWGAADVKKMGSQGTIGSITVSMTKEPHSLKVLGPLATALDRYIEDAASEGPCVLYDGPLEELCPLAPNNVNTMAVAAMASGLGFHRTRGRLIAHKGLTAHIVEIEVASTATPPLVVRTVRTNPADPRAVTGSATFGSFAASLLGAVAPLRHLDDDLSVGYVFT
jgi:aspartate dehydrogenase